MPADPRPQGSVIDALERAADGIVWSSAESQHVVDAALLRDLREALAASFNGLTLPQALEQADAALDMAAKRGAPGWVPESRTLLFNLARLLSGERKGDE